MLLGAARVLGQLAELHYHNAECMVCCVGAARPNGWLVVGADTPTRLAACWGCSSGHRTGMGLRTRVLDPGCTRAVCWLLCLRVLFAGCCFYGLLCVLVMVVWLLLVLVLT